ncbi:hypothetical protein KQ208_002127, partial [Neisseria gonorrhoeae]
SHLSVICFVKERCEIIKYPFRLSKISLDISDIPCYTFQFVRRFGSGEEPNYTLKEICGQPFFEKIL